MKDRFNNAVGPQVRAKKEGPGKVIPALAVVSIAAGLQAATQFFAHDFRYQSSLGANIHQIYAPWGIIQWAGKWYHQYPDAFMRAGSIGVVTAGVGLLSLAVTKMVMANSSKVNEYLHGSARWANVRDIRAAGLIPRTRSLFQTITGKEAPTSSGVYVGAWNDKAKLLAYDIVILSCKAYDLDASIAAIAPAMGATTCVVPLLNGISHVDALDAAFGKARVMGGMCQIAATLTRDGVVKSMMDAHSIVWGARDAAHADLAQKLGEAFARTVVDGKVSDNIMLGQLCPLGTGSFTLLLDEKRLANAVDVAAGFNFDGDDRSSMTPGTAISLLYAFNCGWSAFHGAWPCVLV